MSQTNYSQRDAAAQASLCATLTMKKGLPVELCKRYWRDVHAQIAERIPGFYHNWQHHLAPPEPGLWQNVDGIGYDCPEDEQIHGIGEVTLRSVVTLQNLRTSRAAKLLSQDEQNLFERTVRYSSVDGNARTYTDRIANPAPQGKQELFKLMVFFRARDAANVDEFRGYMTERFAPTLAASEFVEKLRLHLFEPYDENEPGWSPPNVRHDCPQELQYQACVEIAFQNRLARNQCFAEPEVAAMLAEQPKYIRTIHAYPEQEIYTMVYSGERTLVGLRGYAVADVIMRVGAVSQLTDEIQEFLSDQISNSDE